MVDVKPPVFSYFLLYTGKRRENRDKGGLPVWTVWTAFAMVVVAVVFSVIMRIYVGEEETDRTDT